MLINLYYTKLKVYFQIIYFRIIFHFFERRYFEKHFLFVALCYTLVVLVADHQYHYQYFPIFLLGRKEAMLKRCQLERDKLSLEVEELRQKVERMNTMAKQVSGVLKAINCILFLMTTNHINSCLFFKNIL